MGTWGPGVFENDHAADLVGLEMERWREYFAYSIDDPKTSWDDIEGVLVYVKLLVLATSAGGGDVCLVDRKKPTGETSRQIAERWKRRFIEIESTSPVLKADFPPRRREEVESVFDALIAANHYDPPPQKRMRPLKPRVTSTPVVSKKPAPATKPAPKKKATQKKPSASRKPVPSLKKVPSLATKASGKKPTPK